MASTTSIRLKRLEQSNPKLTDEAGIEVVQYCLDPARPQLGSFERHYQYGAVAYDSLAELLDTVNGTTGTI